MYFQATMLMNIGTAHSTIVSAIQKNWKDKTTNMAKRILQITTYIEFKKGNEKAYNIIQIFRSTFLANRAPKGSITNPKCTEKKLRTYYTDYCWI